MILLPYAPRVINRDVLWFQDKAFRILLYVYVSGIMEVGQWVRLGMDLCVWQVEAEDASCSSAG